MVSLIRDLLNLSLQVSRLHGLPMQPRILHFDLFILLRNFPNLLLKLTCVVLALFENSFVLHKVILQVFYLCVAVSDFIEHALDLGSQSLDALCAALDARLLVHLGELGLQIQNFPLIYHHLFAQVFSQLSVLWVGFAVGDF
jgi:hypothetical protein